MDVSNLEKLGLNTNEAKIYLALLEIGQSQAGKISKKAQINRTSVYDTIERLIEKGLVTYVIQANKKVFQPVVPRKILERLKEQEKLAEEILPELEIIHKSSREKEGSNIYKGKKGIKSIMWDILECKEYVAFGSGGQFLEVMGHDFLIFQKEKQKRKMKSRVILGESSRKQRIVTEAYAQFRFVDDKYMNPTTTWVYNDKIAIVIWSLTPIATVIQSKNAAKSYRSYFELLWQTAK